MSGYELALGAAVIALALRAGPVAEPVPSPMTVPPSLQARMASIEPSGIVWAAALERYLVVSDDTGTSDHAHRPWVLAMSREGVLDEEPVPLLGLGKLNDAESICAGPDGTFFLVTSHSPNKKGDTHPSRRMLLWLALEGRALRVAGRVDLTTELGVGNVLRESVLGSGTKGRLDIEALTFREGALLVGLKSPLSRDGAAILLRLDDPVAALRMGHIPEGALKRVEEIPLLGGQGASKVSRGISDMTVLPDGTLVLTANSPKGMPVDGGGALFRLSPGAGEPVLLHTFPGLKPEGVTLAEDGKTLMLVFDNDRLAPLWMRWSVP